MGALRELTALIRAMVRISAVRKERAAGWWPAIGETAREARVSIEAAAESRRRFAERYGSCGCTQRRW